MTHEVAPIFALFPRSGKTALDVPLATHGFAAGFCNIRNAALHDSARAGLERVPTAPEIGG